MTLAGDPFPKVSNAPEAWDSIPEAGKWQIMAFIGFLEYVSGSLLMLKACSAMFFSNSQLPTVLACHCSGVNANLELTT